MTTLPVCCILARIVRGLAAVHRGGSGVHTAIRMAPFNMAGVAGLLATCAAVAASVVLLPLLLLLICPRGIQMEQGKRSFIRPFIRSFGSLFSSLLLHLPLPIYLRRANQAEMIVRGDTSGFDTSRLIATLGCILSQMYRVR